MGEDVHEAIHLYLHKYRAIASSVRDELPNIRAALTFARRCPSL